jgi:hypothetical protein
MIKIYVYYMEPLTIGIIVCVIIVISLAVYFLTRQNTTKNKTKEQTLLDDAPRAFGLSEQFSNETNTTNIVFDSIDKIKNNMMAFLNYLYPKMNVDAINALLPTYGINDKTMQQIFSDNIDTFNIVKYGEYGVYYIPLLFKDEDNQIVIDNIKLFAIVSTVFLNLIFKKYINFPHTINADNTSYKIDYIKFNLSEDYKTNNTISFYSRTNINENIPLEQATINENILSDECLTTLCKLDVDIQTEFIDIFQNIARENIVNCEKLFNLVIIKSLLSINSTQDYTQINKDIEDIYNTLIDAGFDETKYPNPIS